jgi:hypothetical protein
MRHSREGTKDVSARERAGSPRTGGTVGGAARHGAGPGHRARPDRGGPLPVGAALLAVVTAVVSAAGAGVGAAGCAPDRVVEVTPPALLSLDVRDGEGTPLPALVTLRNRDGSGRVIYASAQSLSEVAPGAFGMVDSVALLHGAAVVPVPPGQWRLTVSHGPEFELFSEDVDLDSGARVGPVAVTLERAVDSTGYLSADLHVHAARSQDSTAPLDGRVVAAVVTGLDVLGSADHNTRTDYGPAIEALGMHGRLASLVGNEISLDWAHFSTFPLPYKPEEALGGALPVDRLVDLNLPDAVFAYARGIPTEPLIQVNHPRFENPPSYFYSFGLDPVSCTAAWPGFSYDFQVVEVLNGIAVAEPYLTQVLTDWFCLLRTGHRVTATGNSDSHGLRTLSPGYPRNYVFTGDDDASTYDEARFVQALREQRVVVSSAPFVTITAGEAAIGDTTTVTGFTLPVRVVVQAASWVPVDVVRLVVGGVVAAEVPVPAGGRPRLDQTIEVPVAGETFVMAIAYADAFLRRDVVGEIDMAPIAFTNPIFVSAPPSVGDVPVPDPRPGTVIPPLRAFAPGHRNDTCAYELGEPAAQ